MYTGVGGVPRYLIKARRCTEVDAAMFTSLSTALNAVGAKATIPETASSTISPVLAVSLLECVKLSGSASFSGERLTSLCPEGLT